MGQIITFYSYKGGVGRSMALANTAVLLSRYGYNVLIVDWDLEAPGLEYFFNNFININNIQKNEGIIDLINNIQDNNKFDIKNWENNIIKINIDGKNDIHLISSGKKDDGYFNKVKNFDINLLYANGGSIIEDVRNEWKNNYDYILVDSRTGVTDIGGICTIHLPDILICLFTTTEQSLYGTINVAKNIINNRKKLPFDRYSLIIIPILSKFDSKEEFEISQKWIEKCSNALSELYKNWLPENIKIKDFLEMTKIPYIPYFSFGEKLPIIEQGTIDAGGLGYAYESLTILIANNFENTDYLMNNRNELIKQAQKQYNVSMRLINKKYDEEIIEAYNNLGNTLVTKGLLDEAIKTYYDAIKLYPNNYQIYKYLGEILYKKGLYNDAIDILKQYISHKPNNFDVDTYITIGKIFTHQGLLDNAIDIYRSVIYQKRKNFDAHLNLGIVLMKKGLINEAINEFSYAEKIKPGNFDAHLNLGIAFMSQGLLEKALDEFLETIEIEPNNKVAHYNLGNIYVKKGLFNEAIKEFKETIRLDPKDSLLYLNLGHIFIEMKQWDNAIKEIQKFINFNYNNSEAYNSIGIIYFNKGLWDRAIEAYNKAIELKPDYYEAYNNLGIVYFNKGLSSKAIEMYNKAIELKPDYYEAYKNLGGLYYSIGATDKAKNVLEMASNLYYSKCYSIIPNDMPK